MPPPITVTVNWSDTLDKPVPDQDPIPVPRGQGATVIQWSAGPTVTSFTIGGLDSTVFNPQTQNSPKMFTTTDANADTVKYNYTITGTHTSGRTASHDPKIENGAD